jgi:hypothetical protein
MAVEQSSGSGEEATAPEHADVGVLLVHGIGDHTEGVTLRTFAQPMLDWAERWLCARGKSGAADDAKVTVKEARLGGSSAPAYALVQVKSANEEAPGETWLFCEGWWGAVVQPPVSQQLLRWMWTRAPLLIYWHFYLRQNAKPSADDRNRPSDTWFAVVAFFLAGFCQVVIGVAMLLVLIPFGPWRRKVLDVVNALTLTLGDSYVLEEEIQRVALAGKVRDALNWLASRTNRTVVIAHSQGGAIAHEALQQGAPNNLAMFVTVGSGLEKLHFLREVGRDSVGRVCASLLFPTACVGALLIATCRHRSPLASAAWLFRSRQCVRAYRRCNHAAGAVSKAAGGENVAAGAHGRAGAAVGGHLRLRRCCADESRIATRRRVVHRAGEGVQRAIVSPRSCDLLHECERQSRLHLDSAVPRVASLVVHACGCAAAAALSRVCTNGMLTCFPGVGWRCFSRSGSAGSSSTVLSFSSAVRCFQHFRARRWRNG